MSQYPFSATVRNSCIYLLCIGLRSIIRDCLVCLSTSKATLIQGKEGFTCVYTIFLILAEKKNNIYCGYSSESLIDEVLNSTRDLESNQEKDHIILIKNMTFPGPTKASITLHVLGRAHSRLITPRKFVCYASIMAWRWTPTSSLQRAWPACFHCSYGWKLLIITASTLVCWSTRMVWAQKLWQKRFPAGLMNGSLLLCVLLWSAWQRYLMFHTKLKPEKRQETCNFRHQL